MMEILQREAARLGWTLTDSQLAAFQAYYEELVAWNERANLTAITGYADVQTRHFLDSLTCLLAWPAGSGQRVIDIGAGAGFPGLPIKIVRPDLRLTLVDAVGKKTQFLEHMVQTLALHDVAVLHARAEALGQTSEQRAVYDVALSRAVAELRVLAELALPLVRVGGLLIAQKKTGIDEEISAASRALATLGGALAGQVAVDVPGAPARQLVLLEKVSPSPAPYPRRPGAPQKRPL